MTSSQIRLAGMAVFTAVFATAFMTAPASRAEAAEKLLLMHYMPWYQTPEVSGTWGGHWTGWEKQHDPEQRDARGLPDIWSHFHPLVGTYDSSDPAVLECQLLQMKLAGVDGVIVDWYGITDTADYGPLHDASKVMFEAAARHGMQFAVCYEDRTLEHMVKHDGLTEAEVTARLTETLAWLDQRWFAAPHYVKVDGRPLLLNFGPIYVEDPATWALALESLRERPAFFALHHLWKNAGADGGFTWIHMQEFQDDPVDAAAHERLRATYTATTKDPKEMIVSAFPGFKDVYAKSYGRLDHREGRTMHQTLTACMSGPWPIVQLATWNDYGEGTMIEPTHEFGYRFLEIIQEARREERGASFKFVAEDLRLPARLYELRRAGRAPREALDQIAELLSAGDCVSARRSLDKIEAPEPTSPR